MQMGGVICTRDETLFTDMALYSFHFAIFALQRETHRVERKKDFRDVSLLGRTCGSIVICVYDYKFFFSLLKLIVE